MEKQATVTSSPFTGVAGHEELVHSRAEDSVEGVDVWCRCGKSFRSMANDTATTGQKMLTRARTAHRAHARRSATK